MLNFIEICKMDKTNLKTALETELTNMGYAVTNQDGFLYAEGTVPVLLVAHMDTVHHDRCTIVCTSEDGNVVMSPQGIGGDDRCGIFMVLETIKELNCSVMFTEDEEIGCIGAGKFCKSGIKPTVPINYIIEFDRKNGNDAVFYSCDNPEFEKFITDEEIGFKTASGSCSDISSIAPHLGVAAVNLSCGYYNQHTLHEYVKLDEMMNNIERAKRIILKPSEKFEYIEKVYPKISYTSYYNYGNYGKKKSEYGGSYYPYSTSGYDYYDVDYNETEELRKEFADEIYGQAEEKTLEFFSEYYHEEFSVCKMFEIFEIANFEDDKYQIRTKSGEIMSVKDYNTEAYLDEYCIGLYVDTNCNVYKLCAEPIYNAFVAIKTGDFVEGRDENTPVMYYPSSLVEYPVMDELTFFNFVFYCEDEFEFDAEVCIDEMIDCYK